MDSESLGRSAEKFRDLFDRASRLPRDCEASADLLIRELAAGFDPYSGLGRAAAPATSTSEAPEAEDPALATGARGPDARPSDLCEPDRGLLPPGPSLTCRPVIASRMKWPYSPTFDPRPYLHDGLTRLPTKTPTVRCSLWCPFLSG